MIPKPGKTPLRLLKSFSRLFGVKVYGKLELVNPTGSHKDRESWEVLRDVKAKGFKSVGCASTGNAAISLAAYAFMAGIECHIYVSESINPDKLALIEAFHPKIHIVKGGYGEAIERCNRDAESIGFYNANPGVCYAKIVGNSHIGAEIASRLKPKYVICPTNNGTHIVGVWTGLRDTGVKPVMVAATAEETRVADSIAGFHRLEGERLRNTLQESSGFAVDVSDAEIEEALKLLVRKEGIIAEPASAASLAALKHIPLEPGDVVCCTITGLGLKFPRILKLVL